MNIVEEKFKNKAIQRCGIALFSKADALDFVNECKKNRIPILGIDGFILSEKITQPSLENSVDYSMKLFSENIYNHAIAFLNECGEELYFEIVCSN